jgi:hypothetical protein
MSRLGFALILAAATAAPADAASPDPRQLAVPPAQRARAQALVRKLASDAFAEREEAQEELARMGRLAKAALAEGLATDDAEVRFRCRQLFPRAAAEDLKLRVETFLADAEGKYEHDVPGWNEFRKVVPNNPAARELFAEMLADETNRAMLLAVGGPPGELGQLVGVRKAEFTYSRGPRNGPGPLVPPSRRDMTSADLAAMLFAESQVPARFVPMLHRGPIGAGSTPAAPGTITALASTPGDRGAVYRALVVAWVKTRDDSYQLAAALTVAEGLELKEAAEVAIRLLATPGRPTDRTRGATSLVRLGTKEHLPAIEKLMTDNAILVTLRPGSEFEPAVEIQVRDLALATAVQLTGQKPEDYGFAEQYPGVRNSYANWYVAPEKRDAAFAKWKAWRDKNAAPEKEQDKR